MWRGFAHFGHVWASATLAAHGILTLSAADVWHVCYLQAEADAPSATTTQCSQRETSRAFNVVCVRLCVTWNTSTLSSSEGVINLLSVLNWGCCRKVMTAYQIAFKPCGLAEMWQKMNTKGGKIPRRRERRKEEKWVEMMKQCKLHGCEQSWGRLWSEATHFAWLLLLSFWSWASRHEKQQQLGISLPPTHTPTLPA